MTAEMAKCFADTMTGLLSCLFDELINTFITHQITQMPSAETLGRVCCNSINPYFSP